MTQATLDADTVTRVIVAYNSAEALSWQAQHGAALRTLIVDNASVDDTARRARGLGYGVLAMAENQGFGRGVMAGLRALDTEFALVINPDAALPEEGVAALLEAARSYPDCDLFVPRLLDSQGAVFFRHESSLEPRNQPRPVPDGVTCVPMISGAVMLVRVRPFLAFGGFDPAIFLYFEDDDLALRYRAARRPILYVPQATALHLGDSSSGADTPASRVKDISFGWSRAYLMRKHGRGRRGLRLAAMIGKLMVYGVSGRIARLQRQIGRIQGFWACLGGLPAPFLPVEPGEVERHGMV
jgi:GT2 family glycosyltransferase